MQVENPQNVSAPKTRHEAQKQLIVELKGQWKQMWAERFNDKIKAEGVSINEYTALHVNRGTVIQATRNYKAPNFNDIVKEHLEADADRYLEANASDGGWNKFIKTNIARPHAQRKSRTANYVAAKKVAQQPKKGGRGWLHSK